MFIKLIDRYLNTGEIQSSVGGKIFPHRTCSDVFFLMELKRRASGYGISVTNSLENRVEIVDRSHSLFWKLHKITQWHFLRIKMMETTFVLLLSRDNMKENVTRHCWKLSNSKGRAKGELTVCRKMFFSKMHRSFQHLQNDRFGFSGFEKQTWHENQCCKCESL